MSYIEDANQYDGWLAATPGKGSMKFSVPGPRVRVELNADDGLEYSYGTGKLGDEDDNHYVTVIEWNNRTGELIPLYYEIVPLP